MINSVTSANDLRDIFSSSIYEPCMGFGCETRASVRGCPVSRG
jgi:hypothetical protein